MSAKENKGGSEGKNYILKRIRHARKVFFGDIWREVRTSTLNLFSRKFDRVFQVCQIKPDSEEMRLTYRQGLNKMLALSFHVIFLLRSEQI